MQIQHLPLTDIDAEALSRDRTALDAEALAELGHSILKNGQRLPIEVYALPGSPPPGQPRHGLISGYRRLAALRALTAQGFEGFDTVAAILRSPETAAEAYCAMVEENEQRENLSPYERGRIAVEARDIGLYPSVEDAINALYATAPPYKRARLRAFALVAEELGTHLAAPTALGTRQCLRLGTALREGLGEAMRAALAARDGSARGSDWQALEAYVTEAETEIRAPTAPNRPGRPRRIIYPTSGLTVRRESGARGYALRFSGPECSSELMDMIMDHIEAMFATA